MPSCRFPCSLNGQLTIGSGKAKRKERKWTGKEMASISTVLAVEILGKET